ncbi:MAG: SDR family oxidoreductase [Propionibacteriaceae bacterium]|jgi:NAD(P)-dependent dehydrogenase (short-subunit alcohol dehydrogenase family)|nr:SDR family oxidoreductase [Propionibacteriaceae bacterium]
MSKTALVTGGAGSIGPAVAAGLIEDGFETYVLDVSPKVFEVAERLGAKPLQASVTDEAAMQAAVSGIESLDALVTTVGGWPIKLLDDLTLEDWKWQIDLNLTSVFITVKATLQALRAGKGAIVNFSSSCALQGYADMIPYGAAKAGVIGLTRQLAVALGPDEVNANAIIPGGMMTESNKVDGGWPDWMDIMRDARAISRYGRADDLVGAARFFASPAAKFITGQSLVVDGGYLFQ